jgi:K+ transporter
MKLSYFPHIKIVHTSKVFHGQIYIPFLNWLLMIATIMVAAIYNNVSFLCFTDFEALTNLDGVTGKCLWVRFQQLFCQNRY